MTRKNGGGRHGENTRRGRKIPNGVLATADRGREGVPLDTVVPSGGMLHVFLAAFDIVAQKGKVNLRRGYELAEGKLAQTYGKNISRPTHKGNTQTAHILAGRHYVYIRLTPRKTNASTHTTRSDTHTHTLRNTNHPRRHQNKTPKRGRAKRYITSLYGIP